jgi:hypothetical protein
MRLVLAAGLALFAVAAAPRSLTAQAAAFQLIAPSRASLAATAQLSLPASQPFALERPAGVPMTRRARGNRRQGEILMIVGAAGIVTGLLADEDLITIAGAGVGGFGLYLYLEATR